MPDRPYHLRHNHSRIITDLSRGSARRITAGRRAEPAIISAHHPAERPTAHAMRAPQPKEPGMTEDLNPEMNRNGRLLVGGPSRAPARAMMQAVGYTDEDFQRPLIGVAHCWIEIMPCNFNHRRIAAKV